MEWGKPSHVAMARLAKRGCVVVRELDCDRSTVAAGPTGGRIVAVAFPLWWTSQEVLLGAASANASIVRMTAIPSLLVVRPDDQDGLARLRQAGAWLTFDPQAIAACFAK